MFDSDRAWTCGDPRVYTRGSTVAVVADHCDCPTTTFECGGQGGLLPNSRMSLGGELTNYVRWTVEHRRIYVLTSMRMPVEVGIELIRFSRSMWNERFSAI